MPNGKLIAWIVGLSLATTIALERFRAKSGGGASAGGMRRVA